MDQGTTCWRFTKTRVFINQSPVKLTTLGRSYSKDEKSPTQAESSQDLLENWERRFLTEKLQEMCNEGSALIPEFMVLYLTHPECPQAVRHRKLCYLNAPGTAARIPTTNSAICPEVLRPPKLLFLCREGICVLSFLTESHGQTATAEKKGLNKVFEIAKALLGRDLLLHLSSALYSVLG